MERYWALLDGPTVDNIICWDGVTEWTPPQDRALVEVTSLDPMPGVGWAYDGSAWTPPVIAPPTLPVPESITRRQCAIEMRERGMITAREALDMTRNGTPPAMVAGLFAQMPGDAGIIAETDFAAATYMRSNPLLVQLMQANGASEADIDDFFRAAAAR